MIDETVLLITQYYDYEDRDLRVLRHIIGAYFPAYVPYDIYFYEPLKKIFSKVIVYDYFKRRAEIGLKTMNKEIIALVEKEHPKYVFLTSFNDDIQQLTLDSIRRAGAVTVGWFFDDEWRFNSCSKYWAPHLDYCVTNSIAIEPKYIEMGARVVQTIPNTGIAIERDWSNTEKKYNVSFVGTMKFAGRREYVKELARNNIKIDTFGKGGGGYISFQEMLDIFANSKINLNFSKAGSYYWVKVIKGRVFQVCMAGGFMLTEYVPGIEEYFEIGREIDCFENADEMIEKIEYYLKHDEERRAMARAGWERARHEYTSARMVEKVITEIEARLPRDKEDEYNPIIFKMPIWVRSIYSRYNLDWGRASMEDNFESGFWKDDLALSLRYNPFNIWAWYYTAASGFPAPVRNFLFKLHERVQELQIAVLRRLQSISLLRKMADGFLKKLW